MADAMILIVFIIVMYIIINETEDYLMLLLLGLLFMIVSLDVNTQVHAGSYTTLFNAPVSASDGSLQEWGISGIFATIPLFSFSKVLIRRIQKKKAESQIIPADD